MKAYEIQISIPEKEGTAVYKDRTYLRLSDAIKDLRGLLDAIETDQSLLSDDLSASIVRKSGRKGQEITSDPIVQMVAGIDEDTREFCYEGIYFISKSTDFERMILIGEKQDSWIGAYSVRIEGGKQSEVCFFSDLEMILESIKDLRQDPQNIRNRLMTVRRRKNAKETEVISQLLYTINHDGSLRLQSRVDIDTGEPDAKTLLDFIHDEQNLEAAQDRSEDSNPKSDDGIEDIEAVEVSA